MSASFEAALPGLQELVRRAQDDALWAAYCCTEVVIDSPTGPIQLQPSADTAGTEPPLGPLHVLTACDPGSRGDRAADPERIDRLNWAIAGHLVYTARGVDPTGAHSEASVAVVGLTDAEARELGLRFGQVAVFGWSGPRWSVIACAGGRRTDFGWRLRYCV
jgi:hypothetical protein